MKKLTIILMIILISNIAYSADLSFEYIRQYPQSENYGNSDGLKLTIGPNDSIFYAWLSGEHARFNLTGQNFDYTNLIGAGLGVKYKIKQSPFTLFADAGWFQPFHDKNGDELKAVPGDMGDRCDIYLNEKYAAVYGRRGFDYYTMKQTGNMGASFGIKYNIKGWIVGIAYRMLEIPLRVNGFSYTDNSDRWERYDDQKLSGPVFSIGYEF